MRLARRRRATSGGRRAMVAAGCLLALGAGGAVAQERAEPGAAEERSSSSSKAGYDVKAVQRKLGIRADGVVGPKTRRAIKRFQRRNGLKADGVVGPRTLEALGLSSSERTTTSRSSGTASTRLQRIAQCESGGDPTAVSPDGRYRGKYQFARETWRSLGGTGDPAEASEAEQDKRAAMLMERQGPSAWPTCSKR